MLKVVSRRLAVSIPVLFIVTLLSFSLLQLTPGSAAGFVLGDSATPQLLKETSQELGTDRPLLEQYATYMDHLAHFDLGTSITDGRPVRSDIAQTLPVTFSLGLVGLTMAVLIAVPAGTVAAMRRRRLADRVVTSVAAVSLAIPPFVVALALVIPFAVNRSWFPATGYVPFGENPFEWLRHLILPGLALALVSAAELARQIRGSLVDVFEEDFIRTSRAKGLRERSVIGKHAFRNAAVPAVTVFGLQIGRILSAVVVIEVVFGLPGFGLLGYNSVSSHNIPVIQAIVLISALTVVCSNLLVDVVNAYLNPKLRT